MAVSDGYSPRPVTARWTAQRNDLFPVPEMGTLVYDEVWRLPITAIELGSGTIVFRAEVPGPVAALAWGARQLVIYGPDGVVVGKARVGVGWGKVPAKGKLTLEQPCEFQERSLVGSAGARFEDV